jgi:hypothetical protein
MAAEEFCPHCERSLKADPIPEKYFEHDLTSEGHLRSFASAERTWPGEGLCFCLPYGDKPPEERFYSHKIGNEIGGIYDGVLFWSCPFCGGRWHRFTEGGDLRKRAQPYVDAIAPAAVPHD